MRHICFIAECQSLDGQPAVPDTARQLARQLSAQGHRCTVICPAGSGWIRPGPVPMPQQMERIGKGGIIEFLYPQYAGFGRQMALPASVARLALVPFTEAARQAVCSLDSCPDLFFGHLAHPAGIAAARLGRVFGRPAFMASNESQPWSIRELGAAFVRRELAGLSGIVTASTCEKDAFAGLAIVPPERIGVFPEGVDLEHFYPRGRTDARQRFRIPQDLFVAAYAGSFTEQNGMRRAIQAIAQTHGVYGIYSGSGPIRPSGPKTLFCGQVPPAELPWFYSAADVLLLPADCGSGSAIAGALACGLPAIASRNTFHDDLLDDECSIRVDPDNMAEIQSALMRVRRNGDLRGRQSACAWVHGRRLSLNARARRIAAFLEARSEEGLSSRMPGHACTGRPARNLQG